MGKPSVSKPTPKKVVATPVAKPKVVKVTRGCESLRPLVSKYEWNVNIALAVMRAESGCRSDATNTNYNGTNDAGLFQINSIHVQSGLISDQGRFDPQTNIKAAYAIYRGSGWNAWAAFNNGSYQKYM